jgi:hypothetical protein
MEAETESGIQMSVRYTSPGHMPSDEASLYESQSEFTRRRLGGHTGTLDHHRACHRSDMRTRSVNQADENGTGSITGNLCPGIGVVENRRNQ